MRAGSESGGNILITGGAGYIGCVLVPKLLARHRVVIVDTLLFGERPLAGFRDHPGLTVVRGDIRDGALLARILGEQKFDALYHLAAISNDPCSELDPELTRGVNRVATELTMRAAKAHGVARFINASSASVYGLKDESDVTEDLALDPLTLYARCKAETEEVLNSLVDDAFCGVSVRSATVCGYSPRLRLDLTINILTHHAVSLREIRVFGGTQMRPNVHIEDLTDFYLALYDLPREKLQGRAFNVSTQNATVRELAELVRAEVDPSLPITTVPTADNRSYHLSAARARDELGFAPKRSLAEAVRNLKAALQDGRVADPASAIYRNIEVMKDEVAMRAMTPPR